MATCKNRLCASGFRIRAFNRQYVRDVIMALQGRLKALCADSESRFLAIKKFSRSPPSRRILARQNRLFAGNACG
jgi:hypothetical protein